MIVNFPTAYFLLALPQQPDEAGNVTWTCSSKDPPRSSLFVDQITASLASRPRQVVDRPSDLRRRSLRGELVFTTSAAGASIAQAGTKQYETGQVIDFDTSRSTPLVLDPQLVTPTSEVRHDTNYLDLAQLGFATDEVATLMTQADNTARILVGQLNDYRQRRANLELALTNAQLILNEAVKAQAALAAVLALGPSPDVQSALDKVMVKIVSIKAQQQALVIEANDLATRTQTAQDALLAASQLVR